MREDSTDILFLDGLTYNFAEFSSFLSVIFPMGKMLNDYGFNYRFLNAGLLSDFSIESLISEMTAIRFKTIGISSYATNIAVIHRLIPRIKENFPGIPVILGGPQVSFSAEKTLANCNCDIIIRHEGEYKILKILDYYIRGKGTLDEIKGISYRDQCNGIKHNKDAEPIDLNELPTPDYSIFNNEKFWHIPSDCPKSKFQKFLKFITQRFMYISSRGCPYRCIFCVEGTMEQSHRFRSTEKVKEDLLAFMKETGGVKLLAFGDDTFTYSKERVIEMCEMINELREIYGFSWYVEGRVNILSKYPELIKLLADSGVYRLQVGIESGSQTVLDIQRKGITKEQLRHVFEEVGRLKDYNFHIVGNIIWGLPGQDSNAIIETIEFIKELYRLSNFKAQVTSSYLAPFEGTPIRIDPHQYGLRIINENFEFECEPMKQVVCYPDSMSFEEVCNSEYFFAREMGVFFRRNITKLNKADIDTTYKNELISSRKGIPATVAAWEVSLKKLTLLDRYYGLFFNGTILKDPSQVNEQSFPVGLWDVEYDQNLNSYYFTDMQGHLHNISGPQVFLWEMATGQYTIKEILYQYNASRDNEKVVLEDAISFYINLYNSYALLFSVI